MLLTGSQNRMAKVVLITLSNIQGPQHPHPGIGVFREPVSQLKYHQ